MRDEQTAAAAFEHEEFERLRAISAATSEVVLEFDEKDLIKWTSPSIERVLGYSPKDLIGTTGTSIIETENHDSSDVNSLAAPPSGGTELVRVRRSDGSRLWMSRATVAPIEVGGGDIRRLVALRDIDGEIREATLRIETQAQFAFLTHSAADAVLGVSRNGAVVWATPSFTDLLGWRTNDVKNRELSTFIQPADRNLALHRWRQALAGVSVDEVPLRFVHADGSLLWLAYQARPLETSEGIVRSILIVLRECHREVVLSRALRTMAAASRVLLGAQSASKLLQGICDAAVSEGGYAFAWYGAKVDGDYRVAKLAMTRAHREYLNSMDVTWDDTPSGRGPVGRALRDGTAHVVNDLAGEVDFEPWHDVALIHDFGSMIAIPVKSSNVTTGVLAIYSTETNSFDDASSTPLVDLANQISIGLERLEIRKGLLEAVANHATLVNAVENSNESIMITDERANIVYANPALVRTSGYELDELLGRNPRIFKSDYQDAAVYEQIWAALVARQTWHGQLINQNKSGGLLYEDVTISPIINSNRLTGYVGVKLDLSPQRQLEGQVASHVVERTIVADIMRNVSPTETLVTSAVQLCESLRRLPSFEKVQLLVLDGNGTVVPHVLGGAPLRVIADHALDLGDPERVRSLHRGPMLIGSKRDPRGALNVALFSQLADVLNTELVMIPILDGEELTGALAINQRRDSRSPLNIPLFLEVSSFASNLLGERCRTYALEYETSTYVKAVVSDERFSAHFQPMIDLSTERTVGYEALTRFDDARPAEEVFSDAARVGQTLEIETACARVALREASKLTDAQFVSLNFSPSSILSPSLIDVVATSPFPVVIEITEHESITNYQEIRSALDLLTNCRLAVDDTGSGFSSLRHIMELNPAFVKIDITLIRDIHLSHAKQSLVAGICHYANSSNTIVVAEGIETAEELAVLRELSHAVGSSRMLGQGYLLGRPAKVAP